MRPRPSTAPDSWLSENAVLLDGAADAVVELFCVWTCGRSGRTDSVGSMGVMASCDGVSRSDPDSSVTGKRPVGLSSASAIFLRLESLVATAQSFPMPDDRKMRENIVNNSAAKRVVAVVMGMDPMRMVCLDSGEL